MASMRGTFFLVGGGGGLSDLMWVVSYDRSSLDDAFRGWSVRAAEYPLSLHSTTKIWISVSLPSNRAPACLHLGALPGGAPPLPMPTLVPPRPRDATTLVRLPPSPPSSSPFPPTPPVHKQHNTPWSVSSQLAPLQPTNTATLGLPHPPTASRAWADPTISKISKIPLSQRIWCVVVQKTLRGR